jgi:transposase
METVRDNATRVKRFRDLKATLRTDRTRLLVGLDIAQAEHVVHLRHAHTRVVVPSLTIPNTTRGFTQLWTRIQQAQRSSGCREVVCGLEPTGTYHQGVAT